MPSLSAVPTGSGTSPCCCIPSCSLQYQTKSATATLCGYSEFASPSVPPKKYLTLSQSGGYQFDFSTDSTCSHASGPAIICNWAGACNYDANTCINNIGGTVDCGSGPTPYCGLAADDPGRVTVSSPTNQHWDPTGACFYNGTGWGRYSSLTVQVNLTNEDTEDNAITRANAAIATWDSCIAIDPSYCSAYKTVRGAGQFTLTYRTAQYRIYTTRNTPGQHYSVVINLQRKLHGTSDPFIDWATNTIDYIGVADPYVGIWYQIPVDSGYEVAATSCTVTPIP